MEAKYHVALTRMALTDEFDGAALDEVVKANLGQDALRYQLGNKPHYHCDNNRIAESWAYVEDQHEIILIAGITGDDGWRMRAALGRLFHTVQDFYAHANYVDLWLATQKGQARPPAEAINGLDQALLAHPELRTGVTVLLRDFVYYLPLLGPIAHRIYIPPGSHQEMNLDSPARGWKFRYAFVAAYQRTRAEYLRAKDTLLQIGGEAALQALTTALPHQT
jgi:hypothetical protein